ncbi:uncharacterized protein LOC127790917 [Diospyros lotus]|uniref:uncharacterized protein LOC127790917 n=1 Tax=Diospyros lotus TaxID=55363 RepID=UPI00225B1B21|nr:uncharacterized protein LOC127790917 [Diospyros lotus]
MARHPAICFTDEDLGGINPHPDDPMVISVVAMNFFVKKVLVDQGSSADLLYLSTLRRMDILERKLRPFNESLITFSGEQVEVMGYIDLPTSFMMTPLVRTITIQFLVVDCRALYNALLGRPSLNALGAVVSTFHLSIKFPVSNTEVGVIRSDQKEAQQCYHKSLGTRNPEPAKDERKTDALGSSQGTDIDSQHPRHHLHMVELDPQIEFLDRRPQPIEELHPVSLGPRPEQVVRISFTLPNELKEQLIGLL